MGFIALKKTDESMFNTSRASIGTIKEPFKPKYDFTMCISGVNNIGGFVDTYGNILVLQSGVIYIDKPSGLTTYAKSYEITFVYPTKI